ncbi:hypothetical protein ACIBI7_54560, partial [Nonomuraea fuscirosea]
CQRARPKKPSIAPAISTSATDPDGLTGKTTKLTASPSRLRHPARRHPSFKIAEMAKVEILQHITASPSAIGDIARAALVLTHFEHNYLPAIR